jgi:PadR family transcriptional regulator, regulatory protein PadR
VLNTLDAAEELSKVTVTPPGDWTSQLRRGVLELCILRLLRHRPSYGYEIVTTLDALGPLAAGENTVYPLLRRLKADHYLETFTRESPAGPPRQYYRLTQEGRRRLGAIEKDWGEMVRAVERAVVKGEVA